MSSLSKRKVQRSEKPDTAIPDDAPLTKSDITPAVATPIILKVLGFTFLMVTFPIGSYFVSINTFFHGNATMAGALAAFIANVVLIGFVVVAWMEGNEGEGPNAAKGQEVEKKNE